VLRRYGGQIVAVYRKHVWGHGPDHQTVVRNATAAVRAAAGQDDVPAEADLTYVVIPEWLGADLPLAEY
jgi:hypothetical protein